MTVDHISLHTAVRHETRAQTAVADLLRTGSPRYQAAVELEQARQICRDDTAAGRGSDTARWRLASAEAVWDAIRIADWQVAE
jgi:hypothetical protein